MKLLLDTILVIIFINLFSFAVYSSFRIYNHGNTLQRAFLGIFALVILLVIAGPLNIAFTGEGAVDRLITSTLYLYGYPLISMFVKDSIHHKSVHHARRHLREHVKHLNDSDLGAHLRHRH